MSGQIGELDERYLWHPFTPQRDWDADGAPVIDSAEGTDLIDEAGRRYIDGVSSLWCNVHGHRHPRIDEAVRDQLGKVAHSTMLGLTHAPAARLAKRLVEIAPPGLRRVFYSDSGSTATEIALKMAFQYWQQQGGPHARRTSFVTLRDAYRVTPGDAGELERVIAAHASEIAAVIVEPLVQGAAGIRVQPPGFLRRARELCDRHGLFLICDEVATGFGRTGTMFASEQERVAPDFLCLGKGLTGGYLPLAATLATERVYEGFLGAPEDGRTFFHGHTFTGSPLACAAAMANLDAFESESTLLRLQPKIRLLGELLDEVAAMPEVTEVRGRGFMAGIDLGEHHPSIRLGHQVVLAARRRGAIVRPLGDVIVLMPPLSITKADLRRLVEIVTESIRVAFAGAYGEV